MGINVFEGGRRVRTIVAGIILLLCGWDLVRGGGTPSIALKADLPGQSFRVVPKCDDSDALRYVGYQNVERDRASCDARSPSSPKDQHLTL